MPPAILHGVGVSTKLYFVIFAVFNESMTLNLTQRSFKLIHFGGNRQAVYNFIKAINSNCRFYLQPFRRYCRFYTHTANYVSK